MRALHFVLVPLALAGCEAFFGIHETGSGAGGNATSSSRGSGGGTTGGGGGSAGGSGGTTGSAAPGRRAAAAVRTADPAERLATGARRATSARCIRPRSVRRLRRGHVPNRLGRPRPDEHVHVSGARHDDLPLAARVVSRRRPGSHLRRHLQRRSGGHAARAGFPGDRDRRARRLLLPWVRRDPREWQGPDARHQLRARRGLDVRHPQLGDGADRLQRRALGRRIRAPSRTASTRRLPRRCPTSGSTSTSIPRLDRWAARRSTTTARTSSIAPASTRRARPRIRRRCSSGCSPAATSRPARLYFDDFDFDYDM